MQENGVEYRVKGFSQVLKRANLSGSLRISSFSRRICRFFEGMPGKVIPCSENVVGEVTLWGLCRNIPQEQSSFLENPTSGKTEENASR